MEDRFGTWGSPLGVVLVQSSIMLGDPDGTFAAAMSLAEAAHREHSPGLIVLPESFISGFDYDDIPGSARDSRRFLPIMREKARRMGSSIIFSLPWHERGKVTNRLFCIGEDGSVRGHYDKTHLFSRSGEGRHFSPGSSLRIFVVRGVPIGVLTCYELRYPELARSLALSGAGAIVYLAEWPESRVHQWDSMLRSRAVENQIYALGANVCGVHGRTPMGGHSAIIEPYGGTMASLLDAEGHCHATLDRDSVLRFRRGIPQESDRRKVGRVRTVL